MVLTPQRHRCLLTIFELSNGGAQRVSHDEERLAEFCDDRSTLSEPDVFNQCHDAGWLHSSHDDRNDTSYVRLTDAGRAILVIMEA